MSRWRVRLLLAAAGAWLVTAVGTGPTGAAGTTGPGGGEVRTEPLGWGQPHEGLRLGLLPATPEPQLRWGDTFRFALHVRNETLEPADYHIRGGDPPSFSLVPGGRLRLETGTGSATTLHLEPGEDAIVPGTACAVRIVQPGLPTTPAETGGRGGGPPPGSPTSDQPAAVLLPLVPGEYTVECPYPLWITDKDDPNRATAFRGRPGVLRFRVLGESPGAAVGPISAKAADGITWGEPVAGLLAGISIEPAAANGSAELRTELSFVFHVRNTNKRPVEIQYAEYGVGGGAPWIRDANGETVQVNTVLLSGVVPMARKTLQPGEEAALGHLALKRGHRAEDELRLQGGASPSIDAPAGRYTASLVHNVRLVGAPRMDIVLETGAAPFQIPEG